MKGRKKIRIGEKEELKDKRKKRRNERREERENKKELSIYFQLHPSSFLTPFIAFPKSKNKYLFNNC